MKVLPAFLIVSLLSATPIAAQDSRKQEGMCTSTWQGKLEESDPRLTESNAPYDLIPFVAAKGEKVYFDIDTRGFAPLLALYQIVDGEQIYLESQFLKDHDRAWMNAWIYDDGPYAVMVFPDMSRYGTGSDTGYGYGEPYTDAERPARGNYTIQILGIPCSQ